MNAALTIGLVGNPNCGKTTLFNALTASRQRIGNWPGVTVERKSGFFTENNTLIEAVDLPGCYSFMLGVADVSLDERIACEYILEHQADIIINVLDASNLERNLYLTTQLIEMRIPIIVVLNMMDLAKKRGITISLKNLAAQLDCPVLAIEAHKGKGIKELKQTIARHCEERFFAVASEARQSNPDNSLSLPKGSQAVIRQPALIENIIQQLTKAIANTLPPDKADRVPWLAMRLLEEDISAKNLVPVAIQQTIPDYQAQIKNTLCEEADILLADARYHFIQEAIDHAVTKSTQKITSWTTRIDNIVLNRFLGIPIFLAIMYALFLFAINIGGAFQDFFDIASDTLFVEGGAHWLKSLGSPDWLTALLANGIGRGINTTLTFIPVIGAMFLFLAFLEDSGYMARAAFVIDRLMRVFGLPGKSFVPMIIGFGCNVPSVMATRTLDSKRDRILTIMMSPFMSCGARLAIYTVFTAAFFPVGGQNIVFFLYLLGISIAMLTGLLLRKTLLPGPASPLIMELPPYHLPQMKTILLHAWQRLKSFVVRAGRLIVPICMLLGMLNVLTIHGTLNTESSGDSLLATLGRFITPIFAPMGIHQDNWPATVGLMTGVLAKEVVIGTLNTLYSQAGQIITQASNFDLLGGLKEALLSIPHNLGALSSSLGNPILAKAPVHTLNQSVYGLMYQRFDGQTGAMAYLLFVLLYFPCVSTTAAMLKELNRGWTLFSVVWTSGIAYGVAVLFYQIATFSLHPYTSLIFIISIIATFIFSIFLLKHPPRGHHALKFIGN